MGSTHTATGPLFSLLTSVLTFHFDLIFGPFLTFRFKWGGGMTQKLFWVYPYEQVLSSMISTNLTFNFDLVL